MTPGRMSGSAQAHTIVGGTNATAVAVGEAVGEAVTVGVHVTAGRLGEGSAFRDPGDVAPCSVSSAAAVADVGAAGKLWLVAVPGGTAVGVLGEVEAAVTVASAGAPGVPRGPTGDGIPCAIAAGATVVSVAVDGPGVGVRDGVGVAVAVGVGVAVDVRVGVRPSAGPMVGVGERDKPAPVGGTAAAATAAAVDAPAIGVPARVSAGVAAGVPAASAS